MARETILVCDQCGSRVEVRPVVMSRHDERTIEVDLCRPCWVELAKHGRPGSLPPRAPARMKVTPLPPQPGD